MPDKAVSLQTDRESFGRFATMDAKLSLVRVLNTLIPDDDATERSHPSPHRSMPTETRRTWRRLPV